MIRREEPADDREDRSPGGDRMQSTSPPAEPGREPDSPPIAEAAGRTTFAVRAAEALRYWEPRRLLYNLVLAGVVSAHVIAGWPASRVLLERDHVLMLFLLAVLANVPYCAAYAVDLFVQSSELRASWRRRRWLLLAIGTAFAAVLTHFFMLGAMTS
jgi:uncharacterized membrane protein